MTNNNTLVCFEQGSQWLRADCHLHTRADKEFTYRDGDDEFVRRYIEALQQAGIGIGVITNHNKFDVGEFTALRKRAKKESILLLPGVELSVNDGANGIHMLVVFSDEWIAGGKDYVNQFIGVAFSGKVPEDYEHENARCNLGIIDSLKKLEEFQKPFFIVFAHVEQKSGLWTEIKGGRLEELGKDPLFRKYTLGFQKVRSYNKPEQDKPCRTKIKNWLGWYPAEVEGCDGKSLAEIGRGRCSYLKIGAHTFDAVRYALADYEHRLERELAGVQHSHIRAVRFEGGLMDGRLTWQAPNRFVVKYHGKPLQEHSLGQRASAMMLFILGRQDNELIIIDQPEDDLDNLTPEQIRRGLDNMRNPRLASHASQLLPYRGLGTGISRALKAHPYSDICDDREGNQLEVIIWRGKGEEQ